MGLTWIDILAIAPKHVFLKLILNILKNYTKYTIIIISLQVKQELKEKILSEFQLKTVNLYNIPIGSIKKLVSCFDDKINKYSKQWIRWISLRLSDCKNYYLKNYLKKIFCHVYCFNFHSSQNNFFVTHTRFEKSKELKKHNRRTNANSMAS